MCACGGPDVVGRGQLLKPEGTQGKDKFGYASSHSGMTDAEKQLLLSTSSSLHLAVHACQSHKICCKVSVGWLKKHILLESLL